MSAPNLGEAWDYRLRSLEPGWDGEKGVPITEEAIKAVESFYAVPCSDGGIQLEVHRDGYDIEILISPDGKVTGFLIGHEAKP